MHATRISDEVKKLLKSNSLEYVDLNTSTIIKSGPPLAWLESCVRLSLVDVKCVRWIA